MSAVALAAKTGPDRAIDLWMPLTVLLDEMATMLMAVPAPVYTARPLPGVSGSIGEHVRHALDHIAAFAGARLPDALTYDRRERGTAVESDSGAALRAILRLRAALTMVEGTNIDQSITVTAMLSHGDAPVSMRSTLRRELAFVISHTVHHQALIAMLLAVAGRQVPDSFGLAPSTPRRASC